MCRNKIFRKIVSISASTSSASSCALSSRTGMSHRGKRTDLACCRRHDPFFFIYMYVLYTFLFPPTLYSRHPCPPDIRLVDHRKTKNQKPKTKNNVRQRRRSIDPTLNCETRQSDPERPTLFRRMGRNRRPPEVLYSHEKNAAAFVSFLPRSRERE